jgi:hypothetical protein
MGRTELDSRVDAESAATEGPLSPQDDPQVSRSRWLVPVLVIGLAVLFGVVVLGRVRS